MAQQSYFTSVTDIKDNTVLDDNIGDKKMKVMLVDAENTYLQELLGTPLYKLLKAAILGGTVTAIQRVLIEEYIRPYLWALVSLMAVDYLLVQYTDTGNNVPNPANTSTPAEKFLFQQKGVKTRAVNFNAGLMKTYLDNNITDFAEYNETDEGVPAQKITTFGFFFDDDDYESDDQYYDRKATNDREESI